MRLRELANYASQHHHIGEEVKYADGSCYSVLRSPESGRWIAFFINRWDSASGEEREYCDLKCGREVLQEYSFPWITRPYRMKGPNWAGIRFDEETDRDVVFSLFDRAVKLDAERTVSLDSIPGVRRGFTITLEKEEPQGPEVFRDTPISFSGLPRPGALRSGKPRNPAEDMPARIAEMIGMYSYGTSSYEDKCRNFRRQGAFMADYEDDYEWQGDFIHYFPTYHDLNLSQLRGYFSWRTKLRRGDFRKAPASMVYIYLYELLNGIGASSAEESLDKMLEFEAGYLDSGLGDAVIRKNLHRWMFEFAVVKELPRDRILRSADPETLTFDRVMEVIREPGEYDDETLVRSLFTLAGGKTAESPVMVDFPERGTKLFAAAYREAERSYAARGADLLRLCFGEKKSRLWYPLANAIWYEEEKHPDCRVELDSCRSYSCVRGVWYEEAYDGMRFDRKRLQRLLHEADRQFRKYLHVGTTLREKAEEAWAKPFVEKAIEADRAEELEKSRPKITIDFSNLAGIRADAQVTRESLLTDEERAEEEKISENAAPVREEEKAPADTAPARTEDLQDTVVRMLLAGQDPGPLLREKHRMPSIVADDINEALFEEFGDSVIDCEDDRLSIVEDYREDLLRLYG